MWQYYLSSPLDGKSPGWHDYSRTSSAKLDTLYNLCRASTPLRSSFNVRSGYFHYAVDLTANTQRNVSTGTVRPIRSWNPGSAQQPTLKKLKKNHSALNLEQLFAGGYAHVWEMLLTPLLESMPDAPLFIGPARDKAVVPVRELTFQALKPNLPGDWRVIVFGQNPYPRVESATGIAMFDNAFSHWESKSFGRASSMRCIIKAAAMAKHGIPRDTPISELRTLLQEKDVVSPSKWFQAMLAQGVLLLNASLTVGGDMKNSQHANFWRPVIERVVDHILLAKSSFDDDDDKRGLLVLWWGHQALKTRNALNNVFRTHEGTVPVKHLEWCNPAAQGNKFCEEPKHFSEVNKALEELGQKEIDWLPDHAWMQSEGAGSGAFGDFISDTQKLHSLYLERLQSGLDTPCEMEAITDVMKIPLPTVVDACDPLGLQQIAEHALSAVQTKPNLGSLSVHEKGAVYIYTGNSLYWRLNDALRNPDRTKVKSYTRYLRLFIEAHGKIPLPSSSLQLYRGIGKDLSKSYKLGSIITWWSVSSCSSDMAVAKSFGNGGTLFHIKAKSAVPIMALSAFQGEEEYVLAPGTQLEVLKVKKQGTSPVEIFLKERDGERMVR